MILIIKNNIIRFKNLKNLNLIKMKKLIFAVFLVIGFLFGCENPTESEKPHWASDKRDISTIDFTIYQDYGRCDTNGCIGESLILLMGTGDNQTCYGNFFLTGADSIYSGGLWLQKQGIIFMYRVKGEYVFTLELDNGNEYYLTGEDKEILDLNCNTTYDIQIQ
jgi:hypothetical protein